MLKIVCICVFVTCGSAFRLPFTNINILDSLPGIMPYNFWNKISPWYSMRWPSNDYHSDSYSFGEPSYDQSNFGTSEDAFQMPDYSFSWNMPNFPTFDAKDKTTKTKNKTYEKDGYKITEIKKFGPGWSSYISEAVKEIKSNKTVNGTSKVKDFNFGGDIIGLLEGHSKKFFEQKKCKKCPPQKFCDQLSGKCRRQLKAGSECALPDQCRSPLLCVWGRCNLASQGDAGTFCNRSEFCSGDARCVPYTDDKRVCVPALGEGSICGEKYEGFGFFLTTTNKKSDSDENPCKRGLKCANVGDPENKRCVQLSFKESAEETDKSAKQLQAERENPLVIKKVKERKNNEGSGDDDDAKSTKKEAKKLKSFPDSSDEEPNEPENTNAETSIKNTKSETTDPIKKKGSKTKGSKRKRNSQRLSPSKIVLRK